MTEHDATANGSARNSIASLPWFLRPASHAAPETLVLGRVGYGKGFMIKRSTSQANTAILNDPEGKLS